MSEAGRTQMQISQKTPLLKGYKKKTKLFPVNTVNYKQGTNKDRQKNQNLNSHRTNQRNKRQVRREENTGAPGGYTTKQDFRLAS